MKESKLDALVHYVCARCDDPNKLGATKLNKVLWYSDVFAFVQEGKSITGTAYVKQQFGPVPKNILSARKRLVDQGAIVERDALNWYPQKQFIATRPADISMFSSVEISIVDKVVDIICENHTAASISYLSHDFIWEIAEIGEEIPLSAAAFGSNIGELDEDDMAWAHSEIDRIERHRPSA